MKQITRRRLTALSFVPVLLLALGWDGSAEDTRPEVDRVINVVAERFTFVPSRIKLKLGEVVELRIRSLDTNHGFAIQNTDVNVIIPKRGKGDARILFRAQEKGVFRFVCSKACGAGHTIMRGRIVVE